MGGGGSGKTLRTGRRTLAGVRGRFLTTGVSLSAEGVLVRNKVCLCKVRAEAFRVGPQEDD